MNKRVAVLALIIAVAGGLYVVAHKRRATPPLNASNHPAAPAFTLTGLDGQKLDSSTLKGKVVLIDFWATWCAPCRKEIPRFVELQKQYGNQGFQIVGISMDDSVGPVRDFNQEFKLNYPIVMGDEATADAYGGVLGLPVNILVGRDGHIYAKHAGLTDLQALETEIKTQLQAR